MQHEVRDGRIYRTVNLEAADVHASRRHIMAQPPTPHGEREALRLKIAELKAAS